MNNIILLVNDLMKSYDEDGRKNTVLKNIDLEVREGEFVTIMGPSGSGKSTFLYSISGMDEIDSGEVFFAGKDISKLSETESSDIRLKKMGFIFQNPTLLKNLNIVDNIALPAFKNNVLSKDEIYERTESLMQKTSIDYLEDRAVNKVSGGELQRACICRALINNPDIIFGDEPTGALNSKNSAEIIKILQEINAEGKTIVLVTHDPKVAISSSRVLFLKDGQICSDLNLKDLDVEARRAAVMDEMIELNI